MKFIMINMAMIRNSITRTPVLILFAKQREYKILSQLQNRELLVGSIVTNVK